MAVFSGSMEVQEFSMKEDVEPKTKVYGRPLTEGQRRMIMSRDKRGNTSIDESKLFNLGLAANEKGVYISNIFYNGEVVAEVKDKDLAIEILTSCRDAVFMNEMKLWLAGMSTLDEGEIKNLKSQSSPS